jgi:hypothetical protein
METDRIFYSDDERLSGEFRKEIERVESMLSGVPTLEEKEFSRYLESMIENSRNPKLLKDKGS